MDELSQDSGDFLALITQYQTAIRGYIRGSIGNHHDSYDVLQKTNMVLCKKEAQWNREIPFLKWAFTVARYEILAFYRDKAREKVVFNDEVLELVMKDSEILAPKLEGRSLALSRCLAKMSDENKFILSCKYSSKLSIDEIGERVDRSSNGVRSLLKRLRTQLRTCISKQVETVK